MKSKVLCLTVGLLLLAAISPVYAETAAPPEAWLSEDGAVYAVEGPADAPNPEEAVPPGRCVVCPAIPTLIAPPDGAHLSSIAPLFSWNLQSDPNTTMAFMEIGLDAAFSSVLTNMTTTQKTGIIEYRYPDNFDPATTYYWRSRLYCGSEPGAYSAIRSFTTASGGTVLPAPSLDSPLDGATVLLKSGQTTLDWLAVSGALEYQIQRRIVGSLGGYLYYRTGTELNVAWLDENTTYEWWVRARNSYGYGAASSVWRFRQNLVLESGDYNGDGISDVAIFRDGDGLWAVRGVTRVYFGTNYDIPVSGDYNGDGTTEAAIFRRGSGLWSARGVTRVYYGGSSDYPIPADYDGDGTCDVAIFRGTNGMWSVRGVTRFYMGISGDSPVPGDYNGNGSADAMLFRSAVGLWVWRNVTRLYYGTGGDWPVPGNYSGGNYRPAVFRGSTGMWAVRGLTKVYFGSDGDAPAPGDYNGAGGDDFTIFRDSNGLWASRSLPRVYFGTDDDLPVTR